LKKLVCLEASTKPPIHDLIHEFLINMAFTMACPNFKKGLKMAFGPLRVKKGHLHVLGFSDAISITNVAGSHQSDTMS
jgi:hypothetical protein